MTETPKKQPWLVRVHHRMRTASFALLFAAAALHIVGKGYGPGAWAALAALLLVYPHVQYWRACRSDNAVKVEMGNLVVDSALLGAMAAALAFPLWIAFSAMVGTLVNNTANKGWQGVRETALAMPLGAAAWIAGDGFRFVPHTDWPATLFCIVGLTGYIVVLGNLGFARNTQLRQTREKLRLREQDLLAANTALLKNLREIDALQEQLREQANRDPLTGLYNRRYLDSTLDRELARCKRQGQSLALLMIDVDHFKHINDTYGHQAGDEVLSRLGATLAGMARAEDVACRYGGEEFVLLMPTMPLESAQERAEELRTAFGTLVVPFGDFRLQATLSIGVAVYPGHGTSAEELVKHADRALYRAKHGGRNRVEV
jgi:diguanylate cyclase (GGDEF)-like protein